MKIENVGIRILHRMREVGQEDWDRLLPKGSPFLRWDWLDILEETWCVGEKTGWLPHHIVVERGGKIVGACPLYLKTHSMGEFVFDHEWARYASQIGIRYYPKMLVGIPFTPATGQRFLTSTHEDRKLLLQLMGQSLVQIARENKIASIHVNFCLDDEKEALTEIGFIPRVGLQFHWQNRGYRSFDEYLLQFRSDRRTKVKREQCALVKQEISIRAFEDRDLSPGLLQTMFRLYKSHVDRLVYGEQYLTQEFFEELFPRFTPYICLILAERDSRVIAGTFNIQDDSVFYGRYWGAFEQHRFLHFNVCYYGAIEHCISKGFQRFEAGAGGGFKRLRGLDPEKTHSMHYIMNEKFRKVLEQHLLEERRIIEAKRDELLQRSQLKKRT
jgi:predicted N-acyltransferase